MRELFNEMDLGGKITILVFGLMALIGLTMFVDLTVDTLKKDTQVETATIHTFKGVNESNGELITHITSPCLPEVGQEVQIAQLANGRWVMQPNYYTIDSTTVTITVTGVGKGTEVYTYR